MKKSFAITGALALMLSFAPSFAPVARAAQDTNTGAKQDIKDAGHATKRAVTKTGSATKKGTKKVVNKSAKETKKGADKVQDKTQP